MADASYLANQLLSLPPGTPSASFDDRPHDDIQLGHDDNSTNTNRAMARRSQC